LQAEADLAFAIGGLTMTIARLSQGLDLGLLDTVKRPECAATPLEETRRRLYNHRAAVVIRITGPEGAAQEATRLALCYIATMQMLRLAEPDLLHWAKSNTLYTIEEFRTSTGTHLPIQPRPAPKQARNQADATPRLPFPGQFKGRPFTPFGLKYSEGLQSAKAAQQAVARAMRPLRRFQKILSPSAIASLSAPLSLGYLLQHLNPIEKTG